MTRAIRARLAHGRQDVGSALVLVLGAMLVLAMLAMTALTYAVSSQRFARYDQDYSAAMSAAQSGIEDFISRLNRDDTYGFAPDCLNPAWVGPTSAANPCGWTAATPVGWVPVEPGETDARAAYFHYSVDSSDRGQGIYQLTATGRVNDVYRTIDVTVGKGGSTDYVYYTDFESADPSNVQAYPPSGATRVACGSSGHSNAKYWHTGRSSATGCQEITFIGGDELDGEVFTNDTILGTARSGVKPLFTKQVWTADPNCRSAGATNSSWEDYCLRPGSVANFNGNKPQYHDPLYLPDNSAAFATHPGCHYYGSTRIVFRNDGTMTVWNKRSVNNNTPPVGIALPGGVAPSCGDLTALDSAAGATVAVPTEMVVYVAASTAPRRQCYAGELGGPGGRTLPLGTYTAAKAAGPTGSSDSYRADSNMRESTKFCSEGNLYAEGTLRGRLTLASAQSIVVTGDLVLAGGLNGSDMLGLVATNSVEIFHPRVGDVEAYRSGSRYYWDDMEGEADVSGWPTRYVDPTVGVNNPTSGVQIAGSIQTLQHSFLVQKYDVGSFKGTLLVNGSIAQRWRGIVGTGSGSTGYFKLYRYHTRLAFSSPPFFPKWANSQWSLRYSGEISTPAAVKAG